MRIITTMLVAAVALLASSSLQAQEEMPKPDPALELYQKEIGKWDAVIKSWEGPGDPEVTKGSESNRMLGGFWMISDFKGKMFGTDFEGHGTYSYNPESKKYIGTWIDSLGSTAMSMTGDYDKEADKLTFKGEAPGMDGEPATYILVHTYLGDKRTMSMHVQPKEGEKIKIMEIVYTKSKMAAVK